MNRLQREHEVQMLPFREADEEQVMALINGAAGEKHIPGYHALLDDNIPQLAMKYRRELGLFAVSVWVDGRLGGITLGFPLTQDTMDGCVERHDTKVSGLSYYTQMALILQAPVQYRYMNGEEDLGLAGLRTMKRHLNPCRRNIIWSAECISDN